MAVNFNDLFAALGKLGKVINNVNEFRGTTLPTDSQEVAAQTDFQVYPGLLAQSASALSNTAASNDLNGLAVTEQSVAQGTVLAVVNADTLQINNTNLGSALSELFTQMSDNSESIQDNTLSAVTVPNGNNIGDGSVVTSLITNDGIDLQYALAEDVTVACSVDSITGRVTAGNETFTISGTSAAPLLSAAYPMGSGVARNVNAVSAASDNASGNLTSNGSLESWTGNTPNKFAIVAGTATTDIAKDTTHVYIGTAAANLIGNTSNVLTLQQVFGNSGTGTAATLLPLTSYALNIFAKASGALASGTLTFELYDNTNAAVLQDEAGNNCSFVVNCSALTTSYVAYNGVFRTPRALPAAYSLRIVTDAAIPAGNVYLDYVALAAMTDLYLGGPKFAIFSGTPNFVVNDYFITTVANNYSSNWAKALQQMYDLNRLGLICPNSNAPTQADSLLA